MKRLRVFSMFSGIGGFEFGLTLAGIEYEMVGHSEIDKYADAVYQEHFGGKNYGDATRINTSELPEFDLLVAGFPCQAFSVAGLGRGELDTRGTLFNEVLRICRDKRPNYFILENVKGLLSRKHRRTFVAIIKSLTTLGYHVQWSLCNSSNTGIPQSRERVYITGHLRGVRGGQLLSLRKGTTEDTRRVGIDTSYCLDACDWKGTNTVKKGRRQLAIEQLNNPKHSNDRLYSTKGLAPTLNTMQGGRRQPIILEDEVRPVLTPARAERRQVGRRFRSAGDPAFTVTAQDRHGIYFQGRIRLLTPNECESVQGFPQGWTQYGGGEAISKTQRYKMIGNSVTPHVVRDVALALLDIRLDYVV